MAGTTKSPTRNHRSDHAAVVQRTHDSVTRIGTTYHEVVTYRPGCRFWTFQWWELAGYAYHHLRRLGG
jgi:hypothetical protein